MHALLAYPWRPILVGGVDLDSGEYYSRAALSGIADGKTGLLSAWARFDTSDATVNLLSAGISGSSTRFALQRLSAGNLIRVFGVDNSGNIDLQILSSSAYAASATIRHILASWDSAAGVAHLYMDGADDFNSPGTLVNDNIDFGGANRWAIGVSAQDLSTSPFDGALYELYFTNTYLDLSVEANRLKFRTALGTPADLGEDGSRPTGTAPLVYQSIKRGAAVSGFLTNRGTGGDWTATGTPAAAASSPSD